MRWSVLCVALVACTPAAEPPARGPARAAVPTAQEILDGMVATYRGAKTYADRGTVALDLHTLTKRIAVTTAFVRDGGLRIEFRDDPTHAYTIWGDASGANTTWDLKPGVVDRSSVRSAVGDASGVVGPLAVAVPQLLLADLPRRSLAKLSELGAPAADAIDGHPCWRLDARLGDSRISLWIDQSTHLIRQAVERDHVVPHDGAAFDAVQTATYQPTLDAPVDPVALRGPQTDGAAIVDHSEPPWLGVGFERETSRVTRVFPDSPAAKAGIHVGDEIRELDGAAIAVGGDVVKRVGTLKPGATVAIVIGRSGAAVPVTAVLAARPDAHQLVEGALLRRQAPDFALPVVSGNGPGRLADLTGQVVVVEFWATWCGPCEMAASHLRELQAKHPRLNIVAISDEDPADIRRFVFEYKIPYTIVRDAGDKIASAYLVDGLPMTVVLGKDHVVRYIGVGAGDYAELDAAIEQAMR